MFVIHKMILCSVTQLVRQIVCHWVKEPAVMTVVLTAVRSSPVRAIVPTVLFQLPATVSRRGHKI